MGRYNECIVLDSNYPAEILICFYRNIADILASSRVFS
ncbi:hypothetical protein Pla144_22130 [Bythopirellula polymerisocia]|uniref:Uncharacterized protein n=1 Tax=Bythopirellula polymerisocia TaxID=2528003 RepID=A0A5C6CSB3_9BACT|nr:hypothetical protein Pla144_22130 [Bythopirellula polymerisocia]